MGKTNLEHIYPQNPDPNGWGGPESQERLEPLTWNIGNLTIFGKRANRKAANDEFADKLPRFRQSSVKVTSELVNHQTWNPETILGRARSLAKRVVQVWNFDNPSRV